MKASRCYIYTRVSTSIQVDGYSLDAQKDKLLKYAEFQGMEVMGEYSDEGKSGKNVEGRPEFLKMLRDIQEGKDGVSFVLVFKLSRFGRNAADVLTSLQLMQDYGVNLICVEDGIDSSKDSGKLMISVLSAVAEIERENIRTQTMAGREQKAREGKWNGGFAPYGYKLENGELIIAEDEAEVIRVIYDKFNHTTMGVGKIAEWLNTHDFKKKKRQNNTLDSFTSTFVKGVLDNPVYCGKLAYGRRRNEKISGTHNEYHVVKQEDYMMYDGIHEAIISETEWQIAQKKRSITGVRQPKTYSLEHEHILSGILKCPVCGSGMYGNVNRKRKKDGTSYKDYFYYACKHRAHIDGHNCDYHKQWGEEKINEAVEETIRGLVNSPDFSEEIKKRIGGRIDTDELEQELSVMNKKLRQLNGAKDNIGQQMDFLDSGDIHFQRKMQDLEERQNKIYDSIALLESEITEIQNRIQNIIQNRISADNVYQCLLNFDMIYDKLSDGEKKSLLNSFIEKVEIYPVKQPDGRILKHIDFKFPVFFRDGESGRLSWDANLTPETVVLLSKGKVDTKKIKVQVSLEDIDTAQFRQQATYPEIKEYVLKEFGLKVSSLYISQIKRKCGLEVGENHNTSKSENTRQPQCPEEKEKAIVAAFKKFGMI